MNTVWTQETAKNRFDELIEQALAHHEQIIQAKKQQQVVVISLEDYKEKHKPEKTTKQTPQFGFAKGTFKMADDFDEPLEDFQDCMWEMTIKSSLGKYVA